HRRPHGRPPLPLETSLPGVFAAGDVREGSVARVASAVGEGAAVIPQVHSYLHTTAAAPSRREPVTLSLVRPPAAGTHLAVATGGSLELSQRPGTRLRPPNTPWIASSGAKRPNGADHEGHPGAETATSSAGSRGRRHRRHAATADGRQPARP